ncbi:MAG: PP2C family protein-serine/threonine phosphatase [Leptolyngbyaceae cyanobacterium]
MSKAESASSSQLRYVWAVGPISDAIRPGQMVGDRYKVITPQIWQDTTPEKPPTIPETVPEQVLPYLQSHRYRLHLPGLYDLVPQARAKTPWIVLENAPINHRSGQRYPTLTEVWDTAAPIRQLSWLWQLWQLWQPLIDLGVSASLLVTDNVRVEGWRIRLGELYVDEQRPALGTFAQTWLGLTGTQPAINQPLQQLGAAILAGDCPAEQLTVDLNYLLLKESAQVPLAVKAAGDTHPGPQQPRNEDACYPQGVAADSTMPRIGIVCDGVGGHEAGEVASQLVVRSLRLQLQGLLSEAQNQDQLAPPRVIAQQIEAAIRVVNDLVNRQNDQQGRSDRQRMGTTLVMAVVVAQRIRTEVGWGLVNELYVAHIGDSRAYWITPDYCHQLTVDDDLAGREVAAGRQLYASLAQRSEMGALTQAIGTRDAQHLHPHIQRFVVDEEGILLLCSDGLSDGGRIDEAWANYIGLITKDIITLESAVASWIELANQKNGHDNVAVVLMQCKLLLTQTYSPSEESVSDPQDTDAPDDLTDASRALLYGDDESPLPTQGPPSDFPRAKIPLPAWWLGIVAAGILLLAGLIGWWIAGRLTVPPTAPPESIE